MTETEAETKICHVMPEYLQGGRCVSNKCMSWQRYEPLEFKLKADAEFKKSSRRIPNPHGYCSQGAKPLDLKSITITLEVKEGDK